VIEIAVGTDTFKADGPAPMNFIALVKWIDPEAMPSSAETSG